MSVTPTRCLIVEAGLAAGMSRRGPGALNGTVNWVFSHMILSAPPPSGAFSIASVSWSTGFSRASFFRSTLARSWVSSTGSPHPPTLVLIASFEVPLSEGTMYSMCVPAGTVTPWITMGCWVTRSVASSAPRR